MTPEEQAQAAFNAAALHQQRWGMPDPVTQIGSIASKTASIPGIIAEGLGHRVATAATDPGDEGIKAATDLALMTAGAGSFGAERSAIGMLGGKGTFAKTGSHALDSLGAELEALLGKNPGASITDLPKVEHPNLQYYKDALKLGKITPHEYEGFAQALGEETGSKPISWKNLPPDSAYTYVPSSVDYKAIADAHAAKWKALFEDKGLKSEATPSLDEAKLFLKDKLGYVPAGEPQAWAKAQGWKPGYSSITERALKDLPPGYEKKFKEEDFSKLKLDLPDTMTDEAKQAHLDQIHKILKGLQVPESHIRKLGFNTEFPLYKGISLKGTSFEDPALKTYERGQFLTDDPRIAETYASGVPSDVHSFFAGPKSTLSADWKDLTGHRGYDSADMNRAVEFARKNQADMLILRNMSDIGSDRVGLQNQYPVINTSILRKPEAVFDPRKLKYNDLLAGLAGAGVVGGLSGQDTEH